MATGYYLLDNKQRIRQYNEKRRDGTKPSGVFDVHTFESFPDWVGEDTGVENAVRYLLNRADYGSYHSACDSDSTIRLVPWQMEAFHDRFTNKHAVGISIATQAHKWPQAPREWRAKAIRRAAREAARIADEMFDELGIDVPARWLTQAQAHARVPGFVRHGTSDPGRRSDPWPAGAPEAALFLDEYRAARTNGRYANDTRTPSPDLIQEEDDMSAAAEKKIDQLWDLLMPATKGVREKDGRLAKLIKGTAADASAAHAHARRSADAVTPGQKGVKHDGALYALVKALEDDGAGIDPAVIAAAIPADIASDVVDELVARLSQEG